MSQPSHFQTERARISREKGQKIPQGKLFIIPVSLAVANEFVLRFHSHNCPVPGSKINLGVIDERGLLRGVAILGRPVSRVLDDSWTLEVNRVATDGYPNTCSALYGAARRVARELGYRRLITYTLQSESGASLRGAGWQCVATSEARTGKGWQSRERKEQAVDQLPKYRWEALLSPAPSANVTYPWEPQEEFDVDRCRLIFTRYKNRRLDIYQSVLETMLYITDGRLPFHQDDAIFAMDFEVRMAKEKGLLDKSVVITKQQVQRALRAIVVRSNQDSEGCRLESSSGDWYTWKNSA